MYQKTSARLGRRSTHHAFERPFRVGHIGLDGDTVVQGLSEVRPAANQENGGIGVRSMQREHDGSAFHRIGTAGQEARDGSWHVRQLLYSIERDRVEKTGFVVVS